MEEKDLKKLSHEVIDGYAKLETVIVIVTDGSKTSALISGTINGLGNALVNAMLDKEEFRRIVGLAYLAASKTEASDNKS